MARVLSFSDLMLCSQLSHIRNEVELLSIENDDLVASILGQLGFDLDYGVAYIPAKHRNLQNKVLIGYRVIGEISLNRAFINSPLCSLTERLVATAYTDPSLTRLLSTLTGNHVNLKSILEDEVEGEGEELPEDMLEPDREYVAAQIKQLEEIRDSIRGSPFNEAGDWRTYEEYRIKR